MRRMMVAFVVLALLRASGGALAAKEATSPTEPRMATTGAVAATGAPSMATPGAMPTGLRMELPEAGIAVTFPGDWVELEAIGSAAISDILPEVKKDDPALAGLMTGLGDLVDEYPDEFRVGSPRRDGADPAKPSCALRVGPPGAVPLAVAVGSLLGPFPEGLVDFVTAGPTARRVELPAGLAYRTEYTLRFVRGEGYVTRYDLKLGPRLYSLSCVSLEPSPDAWMSIARTIEPLPDPETGIVARSLARAAGRVEYPEHGFAMTFPDDWTLEATTPEASALQGFGGRAGEVAVLTAASLRPEQCSVIVDDPTVRGEPLFLAYHVGLGMQDLAQTTGVTDLELASIHLPIGAAWRFDSVVDGIPMTVYMTRDHRSLYTVACGSAEPPPDRWQGIVETIESLPDPVTGSSPGPVIFEGERIERPGDGVAVTFPAGWVVEEVTPEVHDWLNPDWDAAALAREVTLLWADQPASDGYCMVTDFSGLAEAPPRWTSVTDATEWFLAGVSGDDNVTASRHTYLDLPAGRTGHITASTTDRGSAQFIFAQAEAWFDIVCWSPDPPEDGWLSIAASFAFLPVEVG